jgi:N-acetylmuramoyl-L-alanine amidase
MTIEGHRLVGAPFKASPNAGGPLKAEYLIIHYTATTNGPATVQALLSPARKASAHLVVDLDGSTTQLVPFDRRAWHAGKSQWAGRSGCNGFSIGIEIVNPGPLRRSSTGYHDVNGRKWEGPVVEAYHKNGNRQFGHWAAYSDAQMQTLESVGPELVEAYRLKDVVGHDDIAPVRKIDPGPAFPMESYRSLLFGRADDGPELFEPTTSLNVRKGPAVSFDPVIGSPIGPGIRVEIAESSGLWWHVLTEDRSVEGWVHSRFLSAV